MTLFVAPWSSVSVCLVLTSWFWPRPLYLPPLPLPPLQRSPSRRSSCLFYDFLNTMFTQPPPAHPSRSSHDSPRLSLPSSRTPCSRHPPHTRTLHASITTIFTTVSTPSRTPGSDDSSHAHPSRSSHNFFTTFFTTFPHDSSVILSPQ